MQEFIDRVKKAYLSRYEEAPLIVTFLTIMTVGLVVTAITCLWNEMITVTLGRMSQHLFMDHFWSVVDSINGPYQIMHVIYPPFIVTVYSVIGYYTQPFVDSVTGDPYLDMYNSQFPMIVFIILLLIGLYLLTMIVRKKTENKLTKNESRLLVLLILLSFPTVIAIQNGNNIIYTVIFCLLFLTWYDSENKWLRYLSYVFLGMAAGMKIMPAIFGLLILRNRKYKEFLICVCVVALISLGPFIFTDGTPLTLLENIRILDPDTGGSITNITKMFRQLFILTGNSIFTTLGTIVSLAMTAVVAVIIVLDRKMPMWKMTALIACCLILGFGVGTPYIHLYMVIPAVYLLSSEVEPTRQNTIITVLISLMLVMIAMSVIDVKIVSSLILLIYLIYLGVVDIKASKTETIQAE